MVRNILRDLKVHTLLKKAVTPPAAFDQAAYSVEVGSRLFFCMFSYHPHPYSAIHVKILPILHTEFVSIASVAEGICNKEKERQSTFTSW